MSKSDYKQFFAKLAGNFYNNPIQDVRVALFYSKNGEPLIDFFYEKHDYLGVYCIGIQIQKNEYRKFVNKQEALKNDINNQIAERIFDTFKNKKNWFTPNFNKDNYYSCSSTQSMFVYEVLNYDTLKSIFDKVEDGSFSEEEVSEIIKQIKSDLELIERKGDKNG